jgi:hypothetical protein
MRTGATEVWLVVVVLTLVVVLVAVVVLVDVTVVVCAVPVPKAKYAPPATTIATITTATAATVVLTPFLRIFMFERRPLARPICISSKDSNYTEVKYREYIERVEANSV